MIFPNGWVLGTWLSRTEWLTVRAIAPLESPFLVHHLAESAEREQHALQKLIFIDEDARRVGSRNPSRWQRELLLYATPLCTPFPILGLGKRRDAATD